MSEPIAIQNLVATTRVAAKLDLAHLASQLPNMAVSHGKRWVGLRLAVPRCYVSLYTGGRAAVTGCKKFIDVDAAFTKTRRLLRDAGVTVLTEPAAIQNIVAVLNLERSLDLVAISAALGEASEYEPEQFPGLVVRGEDASTALLFSSGKVVLTGIRDEKSLETAAATLRNRLEAL